MKVKAKMTGYYDLKREYAGDVFHIEPEVFSEKWMEKLEDEKKKEPLKKASKKPIFSKSKKDDDEVI